MINKVHLVLMYKIILVSNLVPIYRVRQQKPDDI